MRRARVGAHGGDVDALACERLAHEAAHVLVADARQHRDLEAEARQADCDVARRAAEVLGEMLRILEARAALEAVEVDGGAAEADEVDRCRHSAHARGLPPAAGRGGGSQIFASGLHGPRVLGRELGNVVGLAGQVADHPGVVHAVAGRGDLRMIVAGQDRIVSYWRTLKTSSPCSAWPKPCGCVKR